MTEDLAAMIRALDRRVDRVVESLPVDILTHHDLERVEERIEEKVADVSGYEACGACGILHRQRFCPMCDLRVAVRKIARQVGAILDPTAGRRQAVPNQDTNNDKASSLRPPEPIEGA